MIVRPVVKSITRTKPLESRRPTFRTTEVTTRRDAGLIVVGMRSYGEFAALDIPGTTM
jgi:hypothetical protein